MDGYALLTMLLPARIYIAQGPWHFEDFCNIFLLNISKDQKMSHHLSAGPEAPCYVMVNLALVIALRSPKDWIKAWSSNF